MTSTTPVAIRSVPVLRPLLVLGAIAHLCAMSLIGSLTFGMLIAVISTGVGLLAFFLIGSVILAGAAYVLFGVAWVERARVDGLYGFGLPPLYARRRDRPGFVGVLRMIGFQWIDPTMWRSLASFAISTILGGVTIFSVGAFFTGISALIAAPTAPSDGVPLGFTDILIPPGALVGAGIAMILVGAAVVVAMGILHGIIARAILVPSQEQQLAAAARRSGMQRDGAVRAADVERTRIERDLHDGVQPRLVSVGMTLGMAQQKMDTDPEAAKALVAEAHASTQSAITELRQLARGIHASILDDRGLDAALSALISRSHVPVDVDIQLSSRCTRTAEAAVYFAVAEALTNATKHARATRARVQARTRPDGTLWARIEDNGIGGARVVPGGGLDGVINRVVAAGGDARLDSPEGGPTTVEVTVPCGS